MPYYGGKSMQTYTNQQLYVIADENYQMLLHYCNLLQQENYWEQPYQILGYSIQEFLELYTGSLLLQLALFCETVNEEQRNFILTIMKKNKFRISPKQEITEQAILESKKIMMAPPILLQLCGLRDTEKKTSLAGLFFDALINLMIGMSYLNNRRDSKVSVFIKEYYQKVKVFLYNNNQSKHIIDETYIFYKICNGDLRESSSGLRNAGESFEHYKEQTLHIRERKKDTEFSVSQPQEPTKRLTQNRKEAERKTEQETNTDREIKTEQEIQEEYTMRNVIEEFFDALDAKEAGIEDQLFEETVAEEEIIIEESNKRDNLNETNENKSNLTENQNREDDQNREKNKDREENLEKQESLKENLEKEESKNNLEEILNQEKSITEENKTKKIKPENLSEMENTMDKKTRLDELLEELNRLVGLEDVKKEIHSLINLIKVKKMRERYHLPGMEMSYHMVFTGNPGTGKTTVARLVSEIYKELGLLSKGTLVETDRSGLVAGYIGQTALKVKEVVERAIGGVLFIDEAYSLSNNLGTNDFGGEAIDTLVKLMEDNRDNLVVIVAGYTEEMKGFLKANTGLVSRFNKFIEFKDYTELELLDILKCMAEKSGFIIEKEAMDILKEYLETRSENEIKDFGNARGIRNMFETLVVNQANRIIGYENLTKEQLTQIVAKDAVLWLR